MTEHAIEVDKLAKHFGDFIAVRDVSFHVERGEIFGYLGANGAGKSTTIRMLCGLLTPSGGRASVAGHDVASAALGVKSSIGYMSQKFSLYLELEAQHNLEFFAGIYGLSGKRLAHAIDEVVERTGLNEHKRAITGALPGGIRQRLALACSLIHKPQVVFLDEPTAGVDPGSRRDFWRLIRELATQGTTVFVTTHYMDEAEYCARIGLMVDGVLVALDTPDALKRSWVPGEAVSIEGRDMHKGTAAARALPGVRAAELFGARLHVRYDEHGALDRQQLTAALTQAGAKVEGIEPTEASLEDVFLAVARTSQWQKENG
jgi:ABC-2 type transport system ATP-binding protein